MDMAWWTEIDIVPEDYGVKPTGPNVRSLDGPFGAAWAKMTRDLTRGKILCYTCPIFTACRNAGWDEPANIFGGLDHGERFQIRSSGELLSTTSYAAFRTPGPMRPTVRDLFVSGLDVSEIAATLARNESTVWDHIKGALVEARALREDQEKWELQPIPPLPEGVNGRIFRRGLVSSSPWEGPATTPDVEAEKQESA